MLTAEVSFPRTDYPRNRSIVELFVEVASHSPNAPAVTLGNRTMTYGQLLAHSLELAVKLRIAGVGSGDLVAICANRSFELVAAILATLLCGGAYVPLDPDYPLDRLQFMLADTQTSVLLTQPHLVPRLPSGAHKMLLLEELSTEVSLEPSPSTLASFPLPNAQDLAYVMYTSGSTGQPKGVMVPHRAVVRLVRNTNFMSLGPTERFIQAGPISFDALTLELWAPLLNGGQLFPLPPGKLSLAALGQALREHQITSLWLTAGLFHVMVDDHIEDLRGVRQLLAGGDVLSPAHVARALRELPETRLINGYGPTENTVFTCCHAITAADTERGSIPIGRPVANTSVYILDPQLQPVRVGEVGELFTGGDGLASGYWRRPELTAEKFIPNPFDPGSTLYRTGDLCRWLPDGVIEFVGRRDQQVKIRGYRIELGEIEVALQRHPAVRRVCVVARDDGIGDKRLVAYFVPGNATPTTSELKSFLQTSLPGPMVPTAYVPVADFPLDPNGKVDRRALPHPPRDSSADGAVDLKSASELELTIAAIWREVLPIATVGLDDNFFDLGGNSILLARVHDRLESRLGREVPIIDLFTFTTVRSLAAHLNPSPASLPPLSPVTDRARRQREAFATSANRRQRR